MQRQRPCRHVDETMKLLELESTTLLGEGEKVEQYWSDRGGMGVEMVEAQKWAESTNEDSPSPSLEVTTAASVDKQQVVPLVPSSKKTDLRCAKAVISSPLPWYIILPESRLHQIQDCIGKFLTLYAMASLPLCISFRH
ncbi:unnamed protein product, partial [Choristocarpus tenellus]